MNVEPEERIMLHAFHHSFNVCTDRPVRVMVYKSRHHVTINMGSCACAGKYLHAEPHSIAIDDFSRRHVVVLLTRVTHCAAHKCVLLMYLTEILKQELVSVCPRRCTHSNVEKIRKKSIIISNLKNVNKL